MAYTPLVQAWRASFQQQRTPTHIYMKPWSVIWSGRMERDLGGRMHSPARTRSTARRGRATERRNIRAATR